MATANDHTLYAHWEAKPVYTVTVKYGKTVLQTVKTYLDDSFYLPSRPKIQEDMCFVGWEVRFTDGIRLTGLYKPGTKISIRENCVITPVFRDIYNTITDEFE